MGLLKLVGADTRWVPDTQRVITSGVLWYTAHLAVGLAFLKTGTHAFCLERSFCEPKTWGGALARFPWILDKSHLRELDYEQSHPHPVPGTQKKERMPETHPELSCLLMSLESSWRKETKQ